VLLKVLPHSQHTSSQWHQRPATHQLLFPLPFVSSSAWVRFSGDMFLTEDAWQATCTETGLVGGQWGSGLRSTNTKLDVYLAHAPEDCD
jgi:hypothetical protein